MNRFPWRYLAVASALLALVVTILPSGSITGLLEGLSASASRAPYAKIKVTLSMPDERPYVYEADASREDINRLKSRPQRAKRSDFVVDAKKELADKRGYHRSTFGSSRDRLLNGVRVQTIEVEYSGSHRSETLFQSRFARGPADTGILD